MRAPRSLVVMCVVALTSLLMSCVAFAQAVTVSVDNPRAGETYSTPASVVLYATARTTPPLTVISLQIFDGDVLVGGTSSLINGGYTLVLQNAAAGTHVISAVAVDSTGGVTRSADVPVIIVTARQPPQVTLTSPSNGTSVAWNETLQLAANASSAGGVVSRVEFLAGSNVVATSRSPPFVAAWVNPAPGRYTMVARAVDEVGTLSVSAPVYVEVTGPAAPVVLIGSPAAGATFAAGDAIRVDAYEVGGTIAGVELYANGRLVDLLRSPPYNFVWLTPPAGAITLTARATDTRGKSTVSPAISVTAIGGTVPIVALVTPLTGAAFIAPDPMLISANAARAGGSIRSVDFFDGSRYLGTAYAAPYRFTYSSATVGTHTLSARATDDFGGVGVSSNVVVTVADNRPPTVALTAPSPNATYLVGQSVSITATANDVDGGISQVEILNGTTTLATLTTPPYTFSWNGASVGTYQLSARATDDRGATATSGVVSVQVTPHASSSISIAAPASNARFLLGSGIPLSAEVTYSAAGAGQVQFFADGALLYALPVSGPYHGSVAFTWSAASAGVHAVTAKLVGLDSAVSTSVSVTVAELYVELFEPVASQTYIGPANVRVTALAGGNMASVSAVEILESGTVLGTVTGGAPFVFNWPSVPPGTYRLTARAIDSGGSSVTSSPVTVNVLADSTLVLDAGIDGSTVRDNSMLVTGTVRAPLNSAVSVNGALASVDEQGQFFVNQVPLEEGLNELTVSLANPDGTSKTTYVNVTSSGPPPFEVTIGQTEGAAPLQTDLRIFDHDALEFAKIVVSKGDGTPAVEYAALPDDGLALTLTYGTSGTYTLRVTVYDANNIVLYATKRNILVYDPRILGARVTGVYYEMLRRLSAGDVEGALMSVTPPMRDVYRQLFFGLGSSAADAVNALGSIEEVNVMHDFADIVVVRQEADGPFGYHVMLIRDDDGIWRIDGM